ncbi:PRA1 family protein F3-like [Impatiens glandulifera]|uniref:PRA1 family protein F3-like n=1 Tax=Impatiens glandulifera TaxID=253017 RepID=UPI001FB0FD2C|nr:PRA1 family protein F3-like [Impatiens glandulifera]
MTNYGTIPTSSSPAGGQNLEYISRAKQRIKEGLDDRRPWKEFFDYHSIRIPSNVNDAIGRIKTNIAYFRMNYAITVLVILFLSLLWHPISLIVFTVLMAVWMFLYFLRDEPLALFNRTIDDWWVLVALSIVTIVLLLLTNATSNILISLAIGFVVVVVHAVVRNTENLFLDDDDEQGAGTAHFLTRK